MPGVSIMVSQDSESSVKSLSQSNVSECVVRVRCKSHIYVSGSVTGISQTSMSIWLGLNVKAKLQSQASKSVRGQCQRPAWISLRC